MSDAARAFRCAAVALLTSLVLPGCGSAPPLRDAPTIAALHGLGAEGQDSEPMIAGAKRISVQPAGKIDANVLFVHGIGWTQRDRRDQWVLRHADAIEQAFRGSLSRAAGSSERKVTRLCRSSSPNGKQSTYAVGGLQIDGGDLWYASDDRLAPFHSTWVACLDRIDIDLGREGVVHLYRLMWDDLIYDAYQYPLIGYDDGIRSGHEAGGILPSGRPVQGYEDINALRAKKTAEIKTEMVAYGLTEAALYLGPAGELMRRGVAAGICAVIDEAAGRTHVFQEIQERSMVDRKGEPIEIVRGYRELCEPKGGGTQPSLVVVTESLGSKVVFDALAQRGGVVDFQRNLRDKIGSIRNEVLEVFMLANQLPVLSGGTLRESRHDQAPALARPRIRLVAISEINDILSYELVPYFEHLYALRCRNWRAEDASRFDPECSSEDMRQPLARLDAIRSEPARRRQLANNLGFEIVDVRASYAVPIHPMRPDLIDPVDAHTRYLSVPELQQLLVCGLPERSAPPASGCAGSRP